MQEFSQKTGASKLLTVVFIVLGILVGAGGVWYYMDKKANDDKAVLQSQIDDLSKQVSDLNSNDRTSTTTDNNSASSTSTTATDSATTTTTDATAGWKTYSSASFHYSIKYPSTWIQSGPGSTGEITLSSSNDASTADRVIIGHYLSLSAFISGWSGNNSATNIDELIANMGWQKVGTQVVDGTTSTKFLEGALGGNNFDVLVPVNSSNVYFFQFIQGDKTSLNETEANILSSFKFTN